MHLPAASAPAVRSALRRLLAPERGAVVGMLALNAVAAVAALAGPYLLGDIVNGVAGGDHRLSRVDRLAALILVAAVAQILLSRSALLVGYRFGERIAARVREQYVQRVLAMSPATVERVVTGDLVTRGTDDINTVATALRDAMPDMLISAVQALFLILAVLVLYPPLGACCFLGLAVLVAASRWYLRRARTAYLAAGTASSVVADVLVTTADGARTVEALNLQDVRNAAARDAIDESWRTRMHTLFLRSVLFPNIDMSYVLPVVAAVIVGGLLYTHGAISLGAVVSATLYLRQLPNPVDAIMMRLEQMQSSGASFARVEGVAAAAAGPAGTADAPADDRIEVRDVRYAYAAEGATRDVLHGVSLTVRPGERLAVVGPSGAGKSTLGRLLAGVDTPRTGEVTVGGVPVAGLTPDRLRAQVVLVTQEHHVFHESVRDNLRLARPDATDDDLWAALDAVGWAVDLPDGLDTVLEGDGFRLDGAQSQQLSLARVVLADPHTLVLDEATALLDPATARHTEQALAAVLSGRTVIAIAHRLATAHDADRVAAMRDGRIAELGTHDELIAADGPYAALWHSWHGDPIPIPRQPNPDRTPAPRP